MIREDDLVSVIVPAYNAERCLAETLDSIRRQTHKNFEVIIVDDGSKDSTPDIAQSYVDRDPRFLLVRQSNGGVARARNTGIRLARGELVAPCDSDDLWAPDKLKHQMQIFAHSDENIGLVYCWSAVIDGDGMVTDYDHNPSDQGWVFDRMCRGNLIGNGSAVIMLKSAVLKAGGYDATLRDRGAQGCEDFKLYTRISAEHTFGVLQSYGIGYRHTADNMSSDYAQMLRSFEIVMDELQADYPDKAKSLKLGRADLIDWFRMRAWRAQHWREFFRLHAQFMREMPIYALRSMYWSIVRPVIWRTRGHLKSLLKRGKLLPKGFRKDAHPFIGSADQGALWAIDSAASTQSNSENYKVNPLLHHPQFAE